MKKLAKIRAPISEFVRRSSTATAFATVETKPSSSPEEAPKPSPFYTFYHKDLEIVPASPSQMKPKPPSLSNIKFGHAYSDHMFEADWSEEKGWNRPLISRLKNFSMHPGSKALHYAAQLFEGLKAFRGVDNQIRIFRPEMNISRMKRTAIRSALPDFDGEEMLKVILELLRLDKDWVPYSSTGSLYIRPTMIGTDPTLGVAHSAEAKVFVLTGPVGAYYSTGFVPVTLLADSSFIRAFPGGVGSFKMGCNYAPTLLIGKIAKGLGCQQVLWLFDTDEKITEAGTMNVFIYWRNERGEDELVTPPVTDGIILPGITRDSLLTLAREWGEFSVSERYPTMAELKQALSEKRVYQMFGSGTACVVAPIGQILYKDRTSNHYETLIIPDSKSSRNLMQRFYDTIIDIQYGRISRPDWIRIVDKQQ